MFDAPAARHSRTEGRTGEGEFVVGSAPTWSIRHRTIHQALRGSALLRGQGRFINDVNLPGQVHAVFVRSPHAHAQHPRDRRRRGAAGAGRARGLHRRRRARATGSACPRPTCRASGRTVRRCSRRTRPALVADRVRYVGDPVAMVIAETLRAGQGRGRAGRGRLRAAALGDRHRDTVKPGSAAGLGRVPRQHLQPASSAATRPRPTRPSPSAARVVKRRYVITRVHAQYMEPRGALGVYDPGEDRYTLYADVQYPHRVRNMLAAERLQDAREQDARDRAAMSAAASAPRAGSMSSTA